jgi:hypothetical protein
LGELGREHDSKSKEIKSQEHKIMIKQPKIDLRAGLAFVLRTTFITALFVASGDVSAQTATCAVGTQVAFEWSPDTVGTIAEIGTEYPHVGWFGIKFSWSERIQWSAPDSKGLLIAGTKTPCTGEKASSKQTPKTANNPSTQNKEPALPDAQNKGTALPEISGCPLNEPAGKVTKPVELSSVRGSEVRAGRDDPSDAVAVGV